MEIKEDVELLVFGAGQMRTGTNSLQVALQYLYQGDCYHMNEVFKHMEHVPLWQKCVDQRKLDRKSANEIFKGYIATVDHPSTAFYKDLLKLYPNAKVVLTVRDPDSWIRSVRQTVLPKQQPSFVRDTIMYFGGIQKFKKMAFSIMEMTFGKSIEELNNDEDLKKCFVRHNEDVKKIVPEDRLLVFESVEGWKPLCLFLGKEIPNIPYPKVNTAEEFNQMVHSKQRSTVVKLLIPLFTVGLAILYYKFK